MKGERYDTCAPMEVKAMPPIERCPITALHCTVTYSVTGNFTRSACTTLNVNRRGLLSTSTPLPRRSLPAPIGPLVIDEIEPHSYNPLPYSTETSLCRQLNSYWHILTLGYIYQLMHNDSRGLRVQPF